jgi:hypothetical protein
VSFADLIAKKSDSGCCEYEDPESGLGEPSRKSGGLEAFIQRHGHVTEEYRFYNGEITLRFNIDEHVYYRVGELGNLIPVNGVTNTVGIIDKSHMLTPWAAKMAIQKLLRIMPTEMVAGVIRIKPLTFEEFTVIALEAKGAHKEKLDEASDIGHLAHKCLEDSINHAMLTDPEKIVRQLINIPTDQLAANAASSGFNWMQRHNVRWQETETKIYSREHDYAGTMDGLAVCDSCGDIACCPEAFKDRLSLIDWKSSNHLKIEYLFQTASYKHAKMEERPELKILDTWILRLGKSDEEAGKFEPWHMTPDEYEEDFKGFLACLSLTRLVDSVEERMKGQKSTIRAVKKEQRETAKALAKEQEKLQKALDKAAAKKLREEEKVRVKEAAKLKREETKAAKKAGIKLSSVRYKADGAWVVTQPGDPLYSAALFAATETFLDTGWEQIEGKTTPSCGDPTCTARSHEQCKHLLDSLPTTQGTYAALKQDFEEKFAKIVEEMNASIVPAGIQPTTEEVFIGGAPCTSTSKEQAIQSLEKSTSLDSTCQTETSMRKSDSNLEGTTEPNSSPQIESTSSMEEINTQPRNTAFEEEPYTPPFKIPMEG